MRVPHARAILTLAIALLCASCQGCPQYPIYENQATGNTGKTGGSSLTVAIPANTIGNPNGDLLIAFAALKLNPQINGFNTAICGSDDLGIACSVPGF